VCEGGEHPLGENLRLMIVMVMSVCEEDVSHVMCLPV